MRPEAGTAALVGGIIRTLAFATASVGWMFTLAFLAFALTTLPLPEWWRPEFGLRFFYLVVGTHAMGAMISTAGFVWGLFAAQRKRVFLVTGLASLIGLIGVFALVVLAAP